MIENGGEGLSARCEAEFCKRFDELALESRFSQRSEGTLTFNEFIALTAQKGARRFFIVDGWIGKDLLDAYFSLNESLRGAKIFEDDLFVGAALEQIGQADRALFKFYPCRTPDPVGVIKFDFAGEGADAVCFTG